MPQENKEYLMDVQALRMKSTIEHLRGEPELASPEEEGEAAAQRIIKSLRQDRQKSRSKNTHDA